MNKASTPKSHRFARRAAVATVLAALPLGLVAAPAVASAEPAHAADRGWKQDCDHNGPWQWQQNRGNWEWGNCNNGNGHWEYRSQQWQWHHDRDHDGDHDRDHYGQQQSPWFGSY